MKKIKPGLRSANKKSTNFTGAGRKVIPEYVCSESTRNNSRRCKQKQELSNISEDKCMYVYSDQNVKQSTMKDNETDLKSVSNQTLPPTLLLPSCTYIDLTAVQAMCGPGYKALIEKQETDLLHSIFFDNTSGNIIYAVHRQERYSSIMGVYLFEHFLFADGNAAEPARI